MNITSSADLKTTKHVLAWNLGKVNAKLDVSLYLVLDTAATLEISRLLGPRGSPSESPSPRSPASIPQNVGELMTNVPREAFASSSCLSPSDTVSQRRGNRHPSLGYYSEGSVPPSATAQYGTAHYDQGFRQGRTPNLSGDVTSPPPSFRTAAKRAATSDPHTLESPQKKSSKKWSAEEDALIIELRGNKMKWDDISRRLSDRSSLSCRLRYQNFLERRAEWDEEKNTKLSRLYERLKEKMWEEIAKDMQMPWRAVEAQHWILGSENMAQRAGVPPFAAAAPVAGMLPSRMPRGTTTYPAQTPSPAPVYSSPPPPVRNAQGAQETWADSTARESDCSRPVHFQQLHNPYLSTPVTRRIDTERGLPATSPPIESRSGATSSASPGLSISAGVSGARSRSRQSSIVADPRFDRLPVQAREGGVQERTAQQARPRGVPYDIPVRSSIAPDEKTRPGRSSNDTSKHNRRK